MPRHALPERFMFSALSWVGEGLGDGWWADNSIGSPWRLTAWTPDPGGHTTLPRLAVARCLKLPGLHLSLSLGFLKTAQAVFSHFLKIHC